MEQKKHYLVYKTTCLVNGKIYIGQHQTYDLNDDYLGSGILLKRAIEKYGKENFKREILFECSSVEEMNAKEAELVNEDFLKRKDVYNLKEGGEGGFDFIIRNGLNNSANNNVLASIASQKLWDDPKFRKRQSEYRSHRMKKLWKEHPELFANCIFDGFRGRHHSEKSKQKMREKNKILLRGERNGSFGKVWIHNDEVKENKMVSKDVLATFLQDGWKLGTKTAYYKRNLLKEV